MTSSSLRRLLISAALSWHPRSEDEAAGSDDPCAALQNHIPHYGGNRLLADQVVRRLRRLGWLCNLLDRDGKQVCVAERGGIRIEGLPSAQYSDAVCSTALRLAVEGVVLENA